VYMRHSNKIFNVALLRISLPTPVLVVLLVLVNGSFPLSYCDGKSRCLAECFSGLSDSVTNVLFTYLFYLRVSGL